VARRFGRNQRRSLMAQLAAERREVQEQWERGEGFANRLVAANMLHKREMAAAASALEQAEAKYLADLTAQRDKVKGHAARILALLGNESAFLHELTRRQIPEAAIDRLREGAVHQVRRRVKPNTLSSRGPVSEQAFYEEYVRVIDTFAVWATRHFDQVAFQTIVALTDKRGRLCMAMDARTTEAIAELGMRSDVFLDIMQNLAEHWQHGWQKPREPFYDVAYDDTPRRKSRFR